MFSRIDQGFGPLILEPDHQQDDRIEAFNFSYDTEVAIQSIVDLLYLQGRLHEEIFIPVHTNYSDGNVKLVSKIWKQRKKLP